MDSAKGARRARNLLRSLASWRPYARPYYSQEGEDVLLRRMFEAQSTGFYVDVGAHHPRRFSNSYWAYQRGWRGINIDATPGSRRRFQRQRPRDTTLEVCVGQEPGQVEFLVFPEAALNTAAARRGSEVAAETGSVGHPVQVTVQRLDALLAQYMPPEVEAVDFMSIDVEGSEMAVLLSNDWTRFRPRVVVIEVLGRMLADVKESVEVRYLTSIGYVPVSMLYHSVVLVADQELLSLHWGRPTGGSWVG